MAAQLSLKRSPIVVLRTFTLIEVAAFAIYLLAVGHGNYKYDAYNEIAILPSILSYQTAKFLLLSGMEFAITIYAFFRWYYETYTIRPGMIVHRWGVFFKKERKTALGRSTTLTVSSGPLGKVFHYGSIRGTEHGSSKNSVLLTDISYPQLQLRLIEKLKEVDVGKLIASDEHEQLEFKSSLRFDLKQGNVNRDVERAAMKTIAAFLNSHGGNLVLGVNDRREVVGLEADYASLPRKDSDGFENHFTQIFNRSIGPEMRGLVQLNFQTLDGHDVCLVRVAKSGRPVYLKMDDNEYFYVRTGNATTPLKLSEIESYTRSRWPRRVMTS